MTSTPADQSSAVLADTSTGPAEPPAEADRPGQVRRGWRDPRTLAAIAAVTIAVVFVMIRLGPALIGAKVFGPFDLLSRLGPWSDGLGGARPTNPLMTDNLDATVPAYLQIRERLLGGDIPQWSSLAGAGNGLMGNTIKPTLTPTTVWFLAFPTSYALGIVKLAEVTVAVLGMTLWLRRIGVATAAGVLAGLMYCGTGFFVGWSTWTAQAGIAALIPAFLWVLERYATLRTARAALGVAAMAAFLLLGGFPAAAGHALYAGGLYLLIRVVADRRRHSGRQNLAVLAGGLGAVIVGAMISAVQFLPLVTQLAGTDLTYRTNQFFVQLPPESALTTVFPGTFFRTGYGGFNIIEAYAYLGVGAMVLAAVAVITPRKPLLAAGVVNYLAVGVLLTASLIWFQGFWTDWLAEVPIFDANPSARLRDLLSFFVCALAGIGAHQVFLHVRAGRMRQPVIWLLSGLAGALVVTAIAVSDAFRTRVDVSMLFGEFFVGLLIVVAILVAALVGSRAGRAGLFVGMSVLVMLQVGNSVSNYWPLSDKADFYPQLAVMDSLKEATGSDRTLQLGTTLRGSTAAAYGIRSAVGHNFQPDVWKDLLNGLDPRAFRAPHGSVTNPVVTMSLASTPEQSALLDRMSVATLLTRLPAIAGPMKLLDGSPEPAGGITRGSVVQATPEKPLLTAIAPQPVRAVSLHVEGVVDGGPDGRVTVQVGVLDSAGNQLALGTVTQTSLEAGSLQIPLAGENLAGLTGPLTLAVRVDQPINFGGFNDDTVAARVTSPRADGLTLLDADVHGQVWQRASPLPRIRWAGSAEIVTDSEANLARVSDPALPDNTVVLSSPGPVGDGGTASVTVEEDSGDQVRVAVDATGGGYLVVADWMERGWGVTVDGEESSLVLADHAFGAVYLGAGVHEVTFHYIGERAEQGMLLTVLGLLLFLLVACLPLLNRLRQRGRQPDRRQPDRRQPDRRQPDGRQPGADLGQEQPVSPAAP